MIKIIAITAFLTVLCILIQQGPSILGSFLSEKVQFIQEESRVLGDVSSLPPGSYYLSLGRILGPTEIWVDNQLLQSGRVILGAPLEIKSDKTYSKLIINYKAQEKWRNKLYNFPVVAKYDTGLIVQLWRIFNGVFLGPLLSFLLILLTIANSNVSGIYRAKIIPHLILGLSGLLYSTYISSLLDLLFDPVFNTFAAGILRVAFSMSLIYLIGSYTTHKKPILALHAILAVTVICTYLQYPHQLAPLFRVHSLIFIFLNLYYAYILLRIENTTFDVTLLTSLWLTWTTTQSFSSINYWLNGPSYLTTWSPSFVSILACANFYLIYRTAIELSAGRKYTDRMFKVASQVAHDIQSPTATLNVLLSDNQTLSGEEKELVNLALKRIHNIANDLLDEFRNSKTEHKKPIYSLVFPLLQAVIKEKQIEYHGRVTFNLESPQNQDSLFALCDPSSLQRILSNLINNACDALQNSGQVDLSLQTSFKSISIFIRDHGHGISDELLAKLRLNQFETTKSFGNGLGLSFAAFQLKLWGGELVIESDQGWGTLVEVKLQRKT